MDLALAQPPRPRDLDGLVHVSHYSCRRPDDEFGTRLLRVSGQILDDEVLIATTTGKAKELGICRRALPGLHIRLAAAALQLERRVWACLESKLVADPAVECLFYLQVVSYDSADFKLTVSQHVKVPMDAASLALQDEGAPEPANEDSDLEVIEHSRGVKKILQSDQSVLMLLRVGGKLAILRGSCLTWLQVCDRNTAELYKKCLEEQSITTASAGQFARKLRLACTDGAPSIAKTERHIQKARVEEGCDFMHTTCRGHIISGINTRLFALCDDDISCLVTTALALAAAGQMSRLDSARIAAIKAGHAGLSLQNVVVASDAFFPFRDGLDVVVDEGATCVIQPGGSMRDQEVIDAANERGVAMVFTGVRHFRH